MARRRRRNQQDITLEQALAQSLAGGPYGRDAATEELQHITDTLQTIGEHGDKLRVRVLLSVVAAGVAGLFLWWWWFDFALVRDAISVILGAGLTFLAFFYLTWWMEDLNERHKITEKHKTERHEMTLDYQLDVEEIRNDHHDHRMRVARDIRGYDAEIARARADEQAAIARTESMAARAWERGEWHEPGGDERANREIRNEERLEELLIEVYTGYNDTWNGGGNQPFASKRVGDEVYRVLEKTGVVYKKGNQPQWNWDKAGETWQAAKETILEQSEQRGINFLGLQWDVG